MFEETLPPAAVGANNGDAAAPPPAAGDGAPHDAVIADPIAPAPEPESAPPAAPFAEAGGGGGEVGEVVAPAPDGAGDVGAAAPVEEPPPAPVEAAAPAEAAAPVEAPAPAPVEAAAPEPAPVAAANDEAPAAMDVEPAAATEEATAEAPEPAPTATAEAGVAGEADAVAPAAMEVEATPAKEDAAAAPEAKDDAPPSKTPQELHDEIVASRDRLFFVAYAVDKDAKVVTPRKKRDRGTPTKSPAKKAYSETWHLARVDLSTCEEIVPDCRDTGKYYVEFYTKASDDKKEPDSTSRFWIEWHEFKKNKRTDDMIVGKAKEFLPNSQKSIHRRLEDLADEVKEARTEDGEGDDIPEGQQKLTSAYPNADLSKYTTWGNVMDLSDPSVYLVGPFDFEDADLPKLKKEDVKMYDEATQKLYQDNQKDLWVPDRVALARWEELRRAADKKDMAPPTLGKDDATPRKRARKGPFLRLPAKDPLPALDIDEPTDLFTPAIVNKKELREELRSMVDKVLEDARHGNGPDRKTYYVVDEVKATLEEAMGAWAQGRV